MGDKPMAVLIANSTLDMTTLVPSSIVLGAQLNAPTAVTFQHTAIDYDQLFGNFIRDVNGALVDGTVTRWTRVVGGATQFTLTGLNYPVLDFIAFAQANDTTRFTELFSSYDSITGSAGNDQLLGYGGNDTLAGGNGADTLD